MQILTDPLPGRHPAQTWKQIFYMWSVDIPTEIGEVAPVLKKTELILHPYKLLF